MSLKSSLVISSIMALKTHTHSVKQADKFLILQLKTFVHPPLSIATVPAAQQNIPKTNRKHHCHSICIILSNGYLKTLTSSPSALQSTTPGCEILYSRNQFIRSRSSLIVNAVLSEHLNLMRSLTQITLRPPSNSW